MVVAALAVTVSGYGRGAPERKCNDMKPGHGVGPQTDDAPFHVVASRSNFNDNSIKVTLTSHTLQEAFRGFMLQARLGNDRNTIVDGTFGSHTTAQTLNCSGSAVSSASFLVFYQSRTFIERKSACGISGLVKREGERERNRKFFIELLC